MEREEFRKNILKLRTQNQQLINDTDLWSELVLKSLRISLTDKKFLNTQKFQVPSRRPLKEMKRDPEQVKKIINKALERDLYFSLFTFIVAQVEGFMHDVIFQCLLFDNRRLKTPVQGTDQNKKVKVSDIIDCNDKEEIINLVIERELSSIFYAGPDKQKEYFDRVLRINIIDELWNNWIENKSTRDLIVHNKGKINKRYLSKVKKENARGKVGEQIKIDKKYFDDSLAYLKSLIGNISSTLRREFNNE